MYESLGQYHRGPEVLPTQVDLKARIQTVLTAIPLEPMYLPPCRGVITITQLVCHFSSANHRFTHRLGMRGTVLVGPIISPTSPGCPVAALPANQVLDKIF